MTGATPKRSYPEVGKAVVKVSSSSLCRSDGRLDPGRITEIYRQLVAGGVEVTLVSSGAVATGRHLLNESGTTVIIQQAAAASVEEFLKLLKRADGDFEARRARVAEQGHKLCYIGQLEDGRAEVALREIGPGHPFYSLSGSESVVAFTTERYREQPLVIRGPGAGAEVTAAGVLADILSISR